VHRILFGSYLTFAALHAVAADCRGDFPASAPTERFAVTSETVSDKETTLMWTRCAVGQKWDGSSCAGKPLLFGWKEAAEVVARLNAERFAGKSDWRMPMVPELASIVERRCFKPRINEEVFPGAPSLVFWSSMEKRGKSGWAYTLDFGGGEAEATRKDSPGALRLVRGGPWWTPPKEMPPR
jgi:hypothetical protein